MTSTSRIPLARLIATAKTRRAGHRQLPILSMTMHAGLVDQSDKFNKRVASADTSAYKVVSRDQLVVGFPIDEGVLSVQDLYEEAIVSPAYAVWDVASDRVIPAYLERYLRSPIALSYYRQMLRGTTARRRSLPDDLFLAMRVPLPETDEQQRVVAALDKADEILQKRGEAIALAGELLRSAFLDIFGDPLSNPRGFPQVKLSELATLKTGNTPSRARSEYFGDAIEWIKSSNINTPGHYLTQASEGLSALGIPLGRVVPAGSSLITCIAGSPSCIGNVAIADREVAFNQQINAATPKPGVDFRFLYGLLLVGKRMVQGLSTNSMKGMVSKRRLEGLLVPAPPADLQASFGQLFDQTLALSRRQEAALEEGKRLFLSCVEDSFSGAGRLKVG